MLQNIYCYLKVSRFSLQVYQIIEYLGRNHNITSEGLFRKHGNLKKQQALKERLNKVPAYLKNYVLISVVDSKLFYPDPTFLLFWIQIQIQFFLSCVVQFWVKWYLFY